MQHKADISTIHSHSESHCGHQHGIICLEKMLKRPMPNLRLETGVVSDCSHTIRTQALRPALHRATRAGIDQAGTTGVVQSFDHIRHRILGPPAHGVMEVVTTG